MQIVESVSCLIQMILFAIISSSVGLKAPLSINMPYVFGLLVNTSKTVPPCTEQAELSQYWSSEMIEGQSSFQKFGWMDR